MHSSFPLRPQLSLCLVHTFRSVHLSAIYWLGHSVGFACFPAALPCGLSLILIKIYNLTVQGLILAMSPSPCAWLSAPCTLQPPLLPSISAAVLCLSLSRAVDPAETTARCMCAADNTKHVVIISCIAWQLHSSSRGGRDKGQEGEAGTSAVAEAQAQAQAEVIVPPAIKVVHSVAQCALRISVSAFGHLCLWH